MEAFAVKESRELLLRLLREYEGTRHYGRLLMLLAFRENSHSTNRHVSRDLRIPESTLRRWKGLYAEGGIAGLLEMGDEELHYMQEQAAAIAHGKPHPPATADKLIDFLNSLPLTSDTIDWSLKMKRLLIETFDEVDYALVNVSLTVNVHNPIRHKIAGVYRQDVFLSDGKDVRSIRREKSRLPWWRQLLAEGERNGFPFGKYHAPVGFDYYGDPGSIEYVGSIVLFREKRKPPISEETLNLFERTRPFVSSIFVHHMNHLQKEHPGALLIGDLKKFLRANPPLSARESDVILLLMLGHSYDEAAEMLYITKGTVISHVRNVYRKTNVTKLSELFARLFMPFGEELRKDIELRPDR